MSAPIATKKQLRIRMIERDASVRKIAAKVGVTPAAVYMALSGQTRSDRIRAAVSEALGWPASRIWADARRSRGAA